MQHNYQEFRNRQNNLESTASIVFHPEQSRITNPFDFRRTSYSSSFSLQPDANVSRPMNGSRSFASRFSHLSVSRPIYSSFFSGVDQQRGSIDVGSVNAFGSIDHIAKELDESLADDNIKNKMDTIQETFIPAVRTTSPTDVNNDPASPKIKVVENALKNHTMNTSTSASPNVEKETECIVYKSLGDSKKKNAVTGNKKEGSNRLHFCDTVTVVSESNSYNNIPSKINNPELSVFDAVVEHFGPNKVKYSVVQEPLKTENNGDRGTRKKEVRVVDSDTDTSDDETLHKSDKQTRDCSNQMRVDENDLLKAETNVKKGNLINKQEKRNNETSQKNNQCLVIHMDNSDISDDGLNDNGSVEVLMQQRSIRTSSSSTQPFYNENKIYSSVKCRDGEMSSNVSGSEQAVSEDINKTQSLPAPDVTSFFSPEDDGYSLKNFESGGAPSNLQCGDSIPAKLGSSKEDWYDTNSSVKMSDGNTIDNNSQVATCNEEGCIVPVLKVASSMDNVHHPELSKIDNPFFPLDSGNYYFNIYIYIFNMLKK